MAATIPSSRLPRLLKRLTVWPIYPAVLFLLFFFIYPTTLLLGLSFTGADESFSLEHYRRLIDQELYTKVLLITIKIAAWTTLFAILAGYPVAYLLSTVKSSKRNTLIIWVLVPFWTSFLVRTFAWMVLLGRKGALNDLLLTLGIVEIPIKIIYNFTGVMIGMVHALMPLGVLTMLSVMENIDTNLSLVNCRFMMVVIVLDRIFQRDDVMIEIIIHPVDHTGQAGGLAATSWSCHQKQSTRPFDHIFNDGRQPQLLKR